MKYQNNLMLKYVIYAITVSRNKTCVDNNPRTRALPDSNVVPKDPWDERELIIFIKF